MEIHSTRAFNKGNMRQYRTFVAVDRQQCLVPILSVVQTAFLSSMVSGLEIGLDDAGLRRLPGVAVYGQVPVEHRHGDHLARITAGFA